MYRIAIAAILALVLAACASKPVAIPANVRIGEGALAATPEPAANDAPPRILAMNFSSDDVRRGQTWSGTIVTTTNVASVEVRTNLFSINVPRRAFGEYRFTLNVYDVPPIFIRAYRVRVIARNAAGQSVEEDLPLRIR
jgi:hypothetical protein